MSKKTFKRCISVLFATLSASAFSLTALADDTSGTTSAETPGTTAGTPPIWYYFVMLGIFLVVGYFFLVRPEKKRKKEAQELRDTLRPGNKITTIGGIVGTVESVTEENVYLTNGLVLKRWAIRTIDETAPAEGNAAVTYYEEDEEDETENNK